MSDLNNKGQSLVLFVVFIPFILMIGTFIIDVSYAKYNYNKLSNITKETLRYGLRNIENEPYEKMVNLLYKNEENLDEYKIDIKKEEKNINIETLKSSKGIFGSIIGKKIYSQKISYTGFIENDKIIIKKEQKWKNKQQR